MNYEQKYLEILAKEYPNVQRASSELINLTAILNLPKGTEIFITDIHGEYDAFNHYLKNASGIIKAKIDQNYPSLSEQYRNRLAFFIYYPTDMINKYAKELASDEFAKLIRHQLMQMMLWLALRRGRVRAGWPAGRRYRVLAGLGLAILALGWALTGADGSMVTYAALVIGQGGLAAWLRQA